MATAIRVRPLPHRVSHCDITPLLASMSHHERLAVFLWSPLVTALSYHHLSLCHTEAMPAIHCVHALVLATFRHRHRHRPRLGRCFCMDPSSSLLHRIDCRHSEPTATSSTPAAFMWILPLDRHAPPQAIETSPHRRLHQHHHTKLVAVVWDQLPQCRPDCPSPKPAADVPSPLVRLYRPPPSLDLVASIAGPPLDDRI